MTLPSPLDVAWARLVGGTTTPAETHVVRFDFDDRLEPYRALLELIAPLGLACAPEVLELIPGIEGAMPTRHAAAAEDRSLRSLA